MLKSAYIIDNVAVPAISCPHSVRSVRRGELPRDTQCALNLINPIQTCSCSHMPVTNALKERAKTHARSRVSNGKDILPGVDGRSLIARRYRDISFEIFADAGGIDQ